MAQVKNNIVTEGFSGKLAGKLVFRQVKGKTIISGRPQMSEKTTEKQLAARTRFLLASRYAKTQLADPASKAAYEALAKARNAGSAYTSAISDFLKAPEIMGIDVSQYKGVAGNKLVISTGDDYKVTSVQVTISNADNTVVETGAAVQRPDTSDWEYTAKAANAAFAGDKLTIKVTDKPGNVVTEVRTL